VSGLAGEKAAEESRALRLLSRLARHGVALSFVLAIPGLFVGLVGDDLAHVASYEGKLPGYPHGDFDLYEFARNERLATMRSEGILPWSADDALSVRFFRPLASASRAIDIRLFGDGSFVPHLHSLAWFAVLLLVARSVFRKIASKETAALALALLSLAGCYAVPLAWLAARHATICATLSFLALRVYLVGGGVGLASALAASAVALCAGELSLGAVVLVGGYALLVERESLARRVFRAAPFAALAVVYLAFWKHAGYGVRGMGLYRDPIAYPLAFLAALPARVGELLGELTLAIPSGLWLIRPALEPVFGAMGIAGAFAFWFLFRRLRASLEEDEVRLARFLAVSVLALSVLSSPGSVDGRLLVIAELGGSLILAMLLRAVARDGGRTGVPGWVLPALLFAHAGLAPASRLLTAGILARTGRAMYRIARTSDWSCRGDVLVVAGADPSAAFSWGARVLEPGPHPRSMRILSMAPVDQELSRVGPNTFTLAALGERKPNRWEELFRASPVPPGLTVRFGGITATATSVAKAGIASARFEFDPDRFGGGYCFVAFRDGRLRTLRTPDVGERVLVPFEPGPLGP
jgi:hypothetical protein